MALSTLWYPLVGNIIGGIAECGAGVPIFDKASARGTRGGYFCQHIASLANWVAVMEQSLSPGADDVVRNEYGFAFQCWDLPGRMREALEPLGFHPVLEESIARPFLPEGTLEYRGLWARRVTE